MQQQSTHKAKWVTQDVDGEGFKSEASSGQVALASILNPHQKVVGSKYLSENIPTLWVWFPGHTKNDQWFLCYINVSLSLSRSLPTPSI